ncbi:hypothetical protein VTH06DRAFT_4849 [Thermothelomyces fergusii]
MRRAWRARSRRARVRRRSPARSACASCSWWRRASPCAAGGFSAVPAAGSRRGSVVVVVVLVVARPRLQAGLDVAIGLIAGVFGSAELGARLWIR